MKVLNALRYHAYRFQYRFGRNLPLRRPVDVSLELSSICNMRCSYCYHADQKNLPFRAKVMEYGTASRILHQAAALGVPALKFNWKGESSVNPYFEDITAMAKRLAHGSTFQERISNSNFKFDSRRDDIFHGFANQTLVKVSMDSFVKSVFETQRNGGVHEVTIGNIERFYNHPARIKSGTRLVIQAVRTKLNADEDIAAEVKRRWPEAGVSIRDMVAGRVERDLEQYEARRRDASERQSCLQAHVRVIFNHAGLAFPCCPDIGEKLVIGDINKQSLAEIFNGEAARRLRSDLKTGRAFEGDPCRGCSSFETFKGFKPSWNA
jgi:radical SAM protein with 4Fe4S-binding SPASM domain